jgi:hypothetical protein
MVIHPEIIVTPDCPTIKFRQPREQVDLDKELPRILSAQGWGCGTYFHVQFVSHDKTNLLASALFVVTEEVESLQTSEANPYQPVTKTVFSRKAERVSEWWKFGVRELSLRATAVMESGGESGSNAKASWNPGKKLYQVKVGDKVIYETKDKQEANDIADGKIPVPRAA